MHAATVTDVASLVVAAGNHEFIHIRNNDETETIFLKYDGSATTLTVANGFPVYAGGMLNLDNVGPRNIFNKAIYAIAGTGKTVGIRIQGAIEP